MPAMKRVRFAVQGNRIAQLKEVRRFLNELPEHVQVVRAANFDSNGAAYVDVLGDEDAINIALFSLNERGVKTESEEITSSTAESECLNCGNVPDVAVARCPACSFLETQSCPQCGTSVARTSYLDVAPSLYRCPCCRAVVRLSYNDPLFDEDGFYRQPVVVVTLAES